MISLRLLFMGTPVFALPALDLINSSPHNIAAIVTQPDRLAGRGKVLRYSAVKQWAIAHRVETYQPDQLNEEAFLAWLDNLKPDLIVTVAFGRLLPGRLLKTPPLGCVNLHASHLPAYRGSAPIHRAVIEGAPYSGVSIIDLTEELDGGDVYAQEKETIFPDDTAGTLHDRLAAGGAALLLKTINALAEGTAVKTPQDSALATYAPPLGPPDEMIDWNLHAREIHNRIRGLNPWPGAYTTCKGKRVKVWKSAFTGVHEAGEKIAAPGTILGFGDGTIVVATGLGNLTLIEMQPAGKQRMQAAAFCCGYRLEPGERLGIGSPSVG